MKLRLRQSLSLIICFLLLLFPILPSRQAFADTEPIACLYDGDTVTEEFNTVEELVEYTQSGATVIGRLELNQDITITMQESGAGSYIGLMGRGYTIDLNGHTLTFTLPNGANLTASSAVYGIFGYSGAIDITDGSIIMDCDTSGISEGTSVDYLGVFAYMQMASSGDEAKLDNVIILTPPNKSITAAVYSGPQGNPSYENDEPKINMTNCVINVGEGKAVKVDNSSKATATIVSGSYKNLDSNNNGKINVTGTTLSNVTGVDTGVTVYTSENTTAMVVEGGNAYLYDTLQDAVDAKGQSKPDSLATIRLMKSTNEKLTVDENSSFKLVGYSADNTFTGTIVDQLGNTIGAAEDQSWTPIVTNGIATVPAGGSITTEEGTKIIAGQQDGQVPIIKSDGTITVPAGATVQESGGPVVTAPEGGVVVGSDGKIIVSATGITLDRDTLNLYSNTTPNTATLVATVTPENTTDAVEWSSDNEDVATVTQNGVVTAHKDGTATITAKAGEETASCIVTVSTYHYTGKYSYEISVAQPDNGSVAVDKYATEGETVTITATPDDGYMLDTLSVTAGGKELEVTDNGDGTYSFTMPSSKVSITAAFAEDPDWVDPEQPEEPSTTVADIFNDVVPGAWYTDAVQYAYDNGLMTGTSATTFEPNTTTTRGMIVSMLHRLEGSPAVGSADFSDVAGGDWYADPVAWAASEGIVGGYGDGTFGPNDPITREQMASILYRYADYKGLDVSARASLDAYSDADSVSPWASDVMSWAVSEGIISGMTEDTLAPQGTATRAQVAAMFQRFLENVMA